MQGNNRATALVGLDLFLLALWNPKSSAAETNAFLFNARPLASRRLYHPSQISRAEDLLGLSRKVGSTTAQQALMLHNVLKHFQFWRHNYPYGIFDINIEDLIDLDEAGFFLESVNGARGKAGIGKRVKEEGPYGHSEKWTLTMAVSADPNGERWVNFVRKPGTSIFDFATFIQRIVDSLPPGTAARRRCFIMDNLSAHHSILITQIIHAASHRIVFRAPYYPIDGPIEYVFNTIQQELTRELYRVNNNADLERIIQRIINRMTDFQRYFLHCGYTYI
jgi:hypothetical protein